MILTELSAEARAIADLLIATPVGDTVTLTSISQAIGQDVRRRRHIIATARRVAEREAGAVFVTHRTVGYRRLSVEAAADTVGSTARRHIRSTARRAKNTLTASTGRINDLPPAVQRKAAAEISALALVEYISRDANVRPADDAPLKPMPVATAARALLGRLGAIEQ